MSGWQGSDRRQRLPKGWRTRIRPKVFRRDGWQCTWVLPDGTRCPHRDPSGRTLECDHTGHRDDHRLQVLRTLCGRGTPHNHHGQRTAQQGVAARPTRRRPPPDSHPGVIR